jgi:hypothetical protein
MHHSLPRTLLSHALFLTALVGLAARLMGHGGSPSPSPGATQAVGVTMMLDAIVLILFGLQWWALPQGLPRGVRSLVAAATLWLVIWLWRPVPGSLWDASGTWLEPLLWAAFAVGWVKVLLALTRRHALDAGWLLIAWSAPVMTAERVLFAGILTANVLMAMLLCEPEAIVHRVHRRPKHETHFSI